MEIKDIRRTNLRKLLNQFDTDRQFADKAGIAPGFLSQLKMETGKRRRNIGEQLARKIEESLGLPKYWLDDLDHVKKSDRNPKNSKIKSKQVNDHKVESQGIHEALSADEQRLLDGFAALTKKARGVLLAIIDVMENEEKSTDDLVVPGEIETRSALKKTA